MTLRLDSLTDGVFAIALTLLVLELPHEAVPVRLLLAYALGFITLGAFWIASHNRLEHESRMLSVLALLFLASVSLVPWAIGALVQHTGKLSMLAYSIVMGISGLTSLAYWQCGYALTRHHSCAVNRSRWLLAILAYAVASVLSLVSTPLAIVAMMLLQLELIARRMWPQTINSDKEGQNHE